MELSLNPLTPNVNYSGRTAPLTSKFAFYIFIQQIYVVNILNTVYTLRFSLQNAVFFIILTYLVPALFTFYVQSVLCGLVVRVSGYRYRGPGFDPRRYQIF